MPETVNGKPVSTPKPPPHPKDLSPEYHKAHKQLMLWATIMLIWELIGVDLSKAKDAGGNIGPIVTALKSPQAVPWALTGLVIYFMFKCSVEWAQCHVERRKVRFARIDFISAWIVSTAAITLYVGQAISRVQFADFLQNSNRALSSVIGLGSGMLLSLGLQVFRRTRQHGRIAMFGLSGIAVINGLLVLPVYAFIFRINWKWTAVGFILAVLTVIPLTQLAWKLPRPRFFWALPKNS
jgi:hypothetical protein